MLTFFLKIRNGRILKEPSLLSWPEAVVTSYYCQRRGEEETSNTAVAFWQCIPSSAFTLPTDCECTATCHLLWGSGNCLRKEDSLNKLPCSNTSECTMQLFKIDDLQREFQINSHPRTLWLIGSPFLEHCLERDLEARARLSIRVDWCSQWGASWEKENGHPATICQELALIVVKECLASINSTVKLSIDQRFALWVKG